MRMNTRMPNPNDKVPSKLGRPPTGKTKTKVSVSVSAEILKEAQKRANRAGESLSQYMSRALQNQLLTS